MRSIQPSPARPAFAAAFGAEFSRLAPSLASVFDAGGRVDLAQNRPVLFVFDGNELVLFLELVLEGGPLPREGEEGFLDLLDQLGIEIVDVAVARGREGLRLVDRADLRLVEHLAVDHAV